MFSVQHNPSATDFVMLAGKNITQVAASSKMQVSWKLESYSESANTSESVRQMDNLRWPEQKPRKLNVLHASTY